MNRRYIDQEDLDDILGGTKTCVAKLNVGFWEDIVPGDVIEFDDGARLISVTVSKLSFFQNFGDAWFVCGDSLFPRFPALTRFDVNELMRNKYRVSDLNEYGVVVVHFKHENQRALNYHV